MRLDKFLTSQKGVESREKAKFLIEHGLVRVNGNSHKKVAYKVKDGDIIEVHDENIFVSRSGLKLEGALQEFNIDAKNTVCLDIGASTGGFTECLLKYGAKRVYTIDVGTDQLHPKLRGDNRVICYEDTDFRDFDPNKIEEELDLIVIDVSFISINEIIDVLEPFLDRQTKIIALYKPQFEVGKGNLKKGIVHDDELVKTLLNEFAQYLEKHNLHLVQSIKSTLKGKEGNQEYLLLILSR